MNKTKPIISVLYFSNDWNPQCSPELNEGYLKFVKKYPGYEYFHCHNVIGTAQERVKKYYHIKYEPTFLVLVEGCPIYKMIGDDMKLLD